MELVSFFLLLGFAFTMGIRHGIDYDHIAAITDITSSQENHNRAIWYAVFYGIGHGVMVILLGFAFILLGQSIPSELDAIFAPIIGITLIALGCYVLSSVVKNGSSFKMKSRWMLFFSAIKFGYHKFLHNFKLSHHHPKFKEETYGFKTAFGVGLIHGVGAQTPTQIAALAGLSGMKEGLSSALFLFCFVSGIFISNLAVAIFSSMGYFKVNKSSTIYVVIGIATAVFSIAVGLLFLLNKL